MVGLGVIVVNRQTDNYEFVYNVYSNPLNINMFSMLYIPCIISLLDNDIEKVRQSGKGRCMKKY